MIALKLSNGSVIEWPRKEIMPLINEINTSERKNPPFIWPLG